MFKMKPGEGALHRLNIISVFFILGLSTNTMHNFSLLAAWTWDSNSRVFGCGSRPGSLWCYSKRLLDKSISRVAQVHLTLPINQSRPRPAIQRRVVAQSLSNQYLWL